MSAKSVRTTERDRPGFRSIREQDQEVLYQVYASTRTEELNQTDWDDRQKEQFLRMQFDAQHNYYQEHFGSAEFLLILDGADPIGRLYVDRRLDEIRIIDIALLPEQRGRGLGGTLMRDLLDEGQASGRPVRIHVEKFNPALRLYQRLGFRAIEDQGVYLFMEWVPRAWDSL